MRNVCVSPPSASLDRGSVAKVLRKCIYQRLKRTPRAVSGSAVKLTSGSEIHLDRSENFCWH